MGITNHKLVRFENVTKVYESGDKALQNVSFNINLGEFVFCVGESGAGKSTIIKMILGEEEPSIGSVYFDGKSIFGLDRTELINVRRKIGVVFQDFRLIEDMTVFQNVALALRIVGRREKDIQKQVAYTLSLLKLADKFNVYPRQLSGGQKQRVCIARAIVNRPQILLADEPTGSLDEKSAYEIMEFLKLINSQGITVFMVTHMHELIDVMDKKTIIGLENGRISRQPIIYNAQRQLY